MSAVDSRPERGGQGKAAGERRSRLVRRARAHGARREGALVRARRRARREARDRRRRRGDEPRRRARRRSHAHSFGKAILIALGARLRRLRALALRAGDRRAVRRRRRTPPPRGRKRAGYVGRGLIYAGADVHDPEDRRRLRAARVAEREGAQVGGDGARLAGRPLHRRRRRARRDRRRLLEPLSRPLPASSRTSGASAGSSHTMRKWGGRAGVARPQSRASSSSG